MFKVHPGGTVPSFKFYPVRKDPPFKMHPKKAVPHFKMHLRGTLNSYLLSSNLDCVAKMNYRLQHLILNLSILCHTPSVREGLKKNDEIFH